MKNYKIKTSCVSLEGNSMIFILIFMENCLLYDVIHDFSVSLGIVIIQEIIGFEIET